MAKARTILVKIAGDSKQLSGELTKAEKAIGAFGVAAAAGLTKGLYDALGQEANDDLIAARLGLDEATAQRLGDVASGAYRDAWGDSLEGVTDVVTGLYSSFGSLDDSQLESLTGQAIALGDAFQVDVSAGVQSASELVSSGLAGSADEAFDLLTTGLQRMPQGIRDELLAASNEYGDFFADLGISGDEAFTAMTAYAEGGVYGIDKFGDALKELTIKGTDMSTASVEAYEAVGLSADEMAAALLAGGDDARGALDDIATGLLEMDDPVAQANAAIALFGTPLEDLSAAEIPGFLEGIADMESGLGDVGGAAQDMADTLGGNGKATIESYKREALGRLADFVEDTAIPAIEAFAGWVSDLGGVFERNKPLVIGALSGLTIGIGAWAVAAGVAAIANFTLAGSMLAAAAPFVAVGAAIAGLVAGLVWAYDNVEWFRAGVDAAFAWIRDEVVPVVMEIVGGVVDMFQGLIDFFVGVFTADWAKAWEGIQQILDGALAIIGTLLDAAWSLIQTAAGAAWDALKALIGLAIDAVVDYVKALPGRVLAFVGALGSAASSLGESLRNKLVELGAAAVSGVVDLITGLPGKLVALGSTLLSAGANLGSSLVSGIGDALVSLGTTITSPFRSALNTVIGWWNSISFTIPTINIPKISTPLGDIGGGSFGGQTFTVPQLPRFHSGGLVGSLAGPPREVPAILQTGEFVLSRYDVDALLRGGGRQGPLIGTVNVMDGQDLHRELNRAAALQAAF